MLLKLVDVPAGTKFRNMMLKVPNAPFALEVTEFSNMELRPVKPRIQDPGASILDLGVDDLDAALAIAKKSGGEIVARGDAHSVTVRDPDGYYVQLVQRRGAAFGSMVVEDAAKAASLYRDQFGFTTKLDAWTSASSAKVGTHGAQTRTAVVTIPGTNLEWTFLEFKGVDRKPYRPRIPDPGAPAIGLQVRDIDAAIAAVKAAGGSSITQGGSVKLGSGRVGFVRDPSGILVELAQP